MKNSLGTYLNDHRAGAAGAIELLDALVEQHRQDELGRFAAELLTKVRDDRDVLERLLKAVGTPNLVKEAAAWMAQKISHLKLPGAGDDPLGTFEALEALVLGICGKRALWEALSRCAPLDRRLAGIDYDALIRSAQEQIDLVNARRLEMACDVLEESSGPNEN